MDDDKVFHIVNFYDDSETSKLFNDAYERIASEWNELVAANPNQYSSLEFLHVDVGKYPEMKMEASGKH